MKRTMAVGAVAGALFCAWGCQGDAFNPIGASVKAVGAGVEAIGSGVEAVGKGTLSLVGLYHERVVEPEPHTLITPSDALKLGLNVQWATDLALPASQRLSHVAVLDDLIVSTERPENVVTAVSSRNGRFRWQRRWMGPAEPLFEPMRVGDRVLINSNTQLFTLDVGSGRVRAFTDLNAVVTDRPMLHGNRAIYGAVSGQVFEHFINGGYSRAWYQMAGDIQVRPSLQGTDVFVADGRGTYAMFNAETAELKWRGRSFARISAAPVIGPAAVYVASEDQTLYALSRATGRDRWKFGSPKPLTDAPIVIGNTVYQMIPGDGVVALDALTGKEVWRLSERLVPIVAHGSRLLLNGTDNLVAVDERTGEELLRVPVTPLQTVLVTDDQHLILVTQNGRMLRLSPVK